MNNRWITTLRQFLQSIQGTIHLENPWTIPKIRDKDRHLMEDFLNAQLTTKELQIINNCRLHLQVTTLAEITDHTGTRILPEATLSGNKIPTLQRTSESKFNWPKQPAPGKSAWALWTKTIKNQYIKPGMSTQLKTPLGLWTPQANEVRKWYTTYDPDTKIVFVHGPHQPPTKFPIQSTTRTHNYYEQAQPTNVPSADLHPITIESQRSGFRTTTESHPIPHHPAPQITNVPTNLQARIKQSLPKYAPELWHQCTKNTDTNDSDLAEYITGKKGQIFLVSDTSLNTQQRSAFSWTIATETTELWTGGGTSPSTQHDAFSGRSEGYGILAAITFLEHYINATGLIPPNQSPPITGFCDNNGLVQQVTKMQTDRIPNPAQTIANGYDLTNEIYQTIQHLPIPLTLQHVKEHQDSKNFGLFNRDATLNIEADKLAKETLETYQTGPVIFHIPGSQGVCYTGKQ